MQEGSLKLDAARRLRVFLCHSSGDKPAVRDLYRKLGNDGFDPWLDEEKLLPGQDWADEIPKAIRASDAVVVCLSHSSVTKEGYLQREIKNALSAAEEKPEGAIFIIPVRLQDVEVPSRLRQWQWANLYEKDGYERLTRALWERSTTIGIARGRSPQPEDSVTAAETAPPMEAPLPRPAGASAPRPAHATAPWDRKGLIVLAFLAIVGVVAVAWYLSKHTAFNESRVTGEWHAILRDAVYAPEGNQFFLRLKADGSRLFGTATRVNNLDSGEADGYPYGISDGKVEGDRISFWYIGKHWDGRRYIDLKDLFYGAVSGDKIHFIYQVEGLPSLESSPAPVEFTAKRVAGASPGAGSNPK
jgi:hypothetical protein